MLNNPQYAHIQKKFEGADMLVISDFEWCDISTRNNDNITKARRKGMRFFSLQVNSYEYSDKGKQYLNQCEDQYKYIDGKCVNIKEMVQ